MATSRPVWSSGGGRTCPVCGWPASDCRCSAKRQQAVVGDGRVRVGRETKGRKGKGVTLITGLPLDEAALKNLARELKQICGTGGTVKDGVIEIQGDHRDALVVELKRRGYDAKRTGG
ncbi:MAG: translation initiation factor Sui1 [Pseudomonadota bacterium]